VSQFRQSEEEESAEHGRILRAIIQRYEQVLSFCLNHRSIIVAVSLGVVMISIGLPLAWLRVFTAI